MPDDESGREYRAIGRSNLTRNLLLAAIALLLSLTGGIAGGFVADRLNDDPPPVAAAVAPPSAQPSAQPPTQPSERERVRTAVERASPAVVTVLADLPAEQLPDGRVREQQNIGAGVVVSEAGDVITNFHVVDGADAVTIVLATGERRPARRVGDDSPFTDLAVLKVPPQGLRVAAFGDSDALRRGDPVLAIAGGLFGFEHSVSEGVVSATGRTWPRNGVLLEDLVQTDAAVNHGDSGGALVNLDGELVGLITTVVRSDANGQVVQGVAFAQSSNSLRPVIEAIISAGVFPRARPGIERPGRQHLEISPALAEERGLPVSFGALVVAPEPGSPAEAAGILPGDIVVGMNGVAVDFDNPLPNLLKRLPRGADAELLVVRGERQLLFTLSPWVD